MLILSPDRYHRSNQKLQISALMTASLHLLYNKQKNNVSIGPRDARLSFSALIAMGLIAFKSVITNNEIGTAWVVTQKAINLLKELEGESAIIAVTH